MVGKRDGRRGFTLIELVMVFAILTLATAVAVPAFRSLVREDDLTEATRTVRTLFRLARDSAIHGGAPVSVVVDSASGHVWLEVTRPVAEEAFTERPTPSSFSGVTPGSRTLAGAGSSLRSGGDRRSKVGTGRSGDVEFGAPLALPRTITLEVSSARADFTFAPSGQAFGDTLVLTSALGRRTITLDTWTGDAVVR